MLTGTRAVFRRELEDPLMYLPRKGVMEYRRGQVIFDQDSPSGGIHLVIQGRVKVSVTGEDGSQTILGIFSADQFFGECGLLGVSSRAERATALETSVLMSWTASEIEEQVQREPRLGIALIQMLVERCMDFEERLQSSALEKTPQRVSRSLLRFADRIGIREEDGSVRIPAMTHQVISEYVGTSREIVTFQMNQLRRQGYVRYSRRGISVYADALRENLRQYYLSSGDGTFKAGT